MTIAGTRPTPADPMPGSEPADGVPSPTVRRPPPELGPDAVSVLDGRTFMYSDAVGDVPSGSIGGLVHNDTRFLNRWMLTLNGDRLVLLRSGSVDHYSAAFFLTNAPREGLPHNTLGVRRLRFVGRGLHERIELMSFHPTPIHLELRLAVGTDFADLFEIKDMVRDRSAEIVRKHDDSHMTFTYTNGDFRAETAVRIEPPASRVDGDDLVWDLTLTREEPLRFSFDVPLVVGELAVAPAHADFGEESEIPPDDAVAQWHNQRPQLIEGPALLRQVSEKSAADLLALRVQVRIGDQHAQLPAAGLPWFLTLFGRDTLITAYQTVCFGPDLALGALLTLAKFQGAKRDDFTDEEPGRILHEARNGELTQLGLKPHRPYYGAADATQLWLILLSEYWKWTLDDDLVRDLRGQIDAALRWIDEYGDRDGDGYVEYATRSPQGLGNQCWRDSWDGVQFADGTIPYLPIATCEVQGYTYDAKLRVAELAEGPLDDLALAARLRGEAQLLRDRFNRDFWVDARGGYYAIGLDGDKRQIDSMTSNMGHLLWSGIVPRDRADVIARQLMSPKLYSGWGIRTLSTEDYGYNPIGYHLGTVWPHDTSLIAAGLARYGHRDEANTLAVALLEAAATTGFRLPEAISGYAREYGAFPVPYPTACSPQAWATGAPLLLLRTMLGLDARNGRVVLDPAIPEDMGRILIARSEAFGRRWDVEAVGTTGHVRLSQ